ncbi:MAG: type IV pilus modification protein PilV [Gammaproteobacteria bacterium]
MRLRNSNSLSKRMTSRQQGFTLLEVMVALVIFSIGLLGLADLQIKAVDYNNGAYQRSQASFLISDIMDRMRANKDTALNGGYDLTSSKSYSQSASCDGTSANCQPGTQAIADLSEWKQALKVLPGGDGSITRNTNSGPIPVFIVKVTWNDKYSSKGTSSLTIKSEL